MDILLFEELLHETFRLLHFAYYKRDEGRLSFPEDRSGNIRISEQELRMQFIEVFLNDPRCKHMSYSIETPTKLAYSFTHDGKEYADFLEPTIEYKNGYRSANIDLVIFDGTERIALIEFKAGNPRCFSYKKDIFKLTKEPGVNLLRCFVELFDSTTEKTLKNVQTKLFSYPFYTNSEEANKPQFFGYSFCHNKGQGAILKSIKNKIYNETTPYISSSVLD